MTHPPAGQKKETGAIWLHRAIRQSAIWDAPPAYLKVWLHILLTVPYSGDRVGERAYFIGRERLSGISNDQWSRAIAWLRAQGSITTLKIRQGVVIKVTNFGQYQKLTSATKQPTLPTSPLSAMWQKKTGGSLSPSSMVLLERLLNTHGPEKVTTALQHYLEATDTRYVSVARLAETFGNWLVAAEPKQQTHQARGRSSLTGHKGTTNYDAIDPTTHD